LATGGKKMKGLVLAIALALLYPISANGWTSYKHITDLNEDEHEAMNSLLHKLYENVTGGNTCFYYETTYYYMPEKDGGVGEKLDKPISVLSCACIGSYMNLPSTLRKLEELMTSKGVAWGEIDSGTMKHLEIIEGFVVSSPGGAGGSMSLSNDMATIVPVRMKIY